MRNSLCHSWNISGFSGPRLVQPITHPMSHSTQSGFKAPLISAGVIIAFSFSRDHAPPHLHKAAPPDAVTAVGVGKYDLASRFFPLSAPRMWTAFVFVDVGVG